MTAAPTLLLVLVLALGGVEGRVTSASDGGPLAGASVVVDSLERVVRTDADGRFRIDSLRAGRWALVIRAAGHEERRVVVRVPVEGSVRLDVELTPEPARSAEPRTARLSGEVHETSRLEAVRYALVEVPAADRRTLTDEHGRFRLRLPEGRWSLRVTAPGYERLERTVEVRSGRPVGVELLLEPDPIPVMEVIAMSARLRAGVTRVEAPEAVVVDSVLVDMLPVAVERDVLRAVQVLPAVTPSSDFSSALFVRGGTPDQTRIFLDGAPVYNPFHIGGFASAISPSATAAAVLRPGALPASAASSLSGMLEIHTRNGARDSVRIRGGLGLLSSSATVDGPLAAGKGTFLVSGRRTYVDAGSKVAEGLGLVREDFPYGFSDLLAKVTWDLSGRGSLALSGYLDREGYDDRADIVADWGSDVVSARVSRLLGDRYEVGGGVARSGFHMDVQRPPRPRFGSGSPEIRDPTDLDASVRTWAVDARLRADAGDHHLFAGARWEDTRVDHRFRPESGDEDVVPDLTVDDVYGTTAFFVRDRWSPGGGWTLDAGVRAERPRDRTWFLLPRGRLERELGDGASVAVAAGRYVQNWWSLRNEESVTASVVGYDVPTAVPDDRPVPRAWDVVVEGRARARGWTLRADAFLKRIRRVPVDTVPLDVLNAPLARDPDDVRLGESRVEGVELSATGGVLGTGVNLSYRLQRERREVDGRSFTPRSDRTHRLVASVSRPWGEREIAAAFTWMSGLPYTPPVAGLPTVTDVEPGGRPINPGFGGRRVVLGLPNSARLGGYLRLDVDVRDQWDLTLFGRRGILEPYLSVLNLFNQHNALVVDHRATGEALVLEVGPQLPILPSFGVRWRF